MATLTIEISGRLDQKTCAALLKRFRDFHPGDVVYRGARFAHRLYLPGEIKEAWTLFITGPRIRTWGFYCPQGWRDWRIFTSSADRGRIGRGCE